MSHQVETMFSGSNQVPWHGLGTIINGTANSQEALKLAGLDWEVEKRRILSVNPNGNDMIPDYFANVRSSDNKVLGIVKGKYKIVQNLEAFSFVDNLLEQDKEVQYETAGSLREGKLIWMLTKLPKFQLLNDEVDSYLCFTNQHDGYGSVKVMVTPVRVVCQNTLNLAIDSATRSWSCVHSGDITNKMEEAKQTLQLASKYILELKNEAELLQQIKVNFEDLIEILVPFGKDDTARVIMSKTQVRESILSLTTVDNLQKFGNSGWALVNAVSDYAFHREPKRLTSTFQEKTWESVINGNYYLDKVYELLRVRR